MPAGDPVTGRWGNGRRAARHRLTTDAANPREHHTPRSPFCIPTFPLSHFPTFPLSHFLTFPLCLASLLLAQTPGSEAGLEKGALGAPYVDGSFGFSIRPPAGCLTYREKRMLSRADVELVRFVHADHQWNLAVHRSATTRPLGTQDIIDEITKKIAEKTQDYAVLRAEAAQIAARDGVRYAASFTIRETGWLRQQVVIRNHETEYYSLILIVPLPDKDVAVEAFDKIVQSFELLRSRVAEEQIEEALDRGASLLSSVAGGKTPLADRKVPESFLRFIQDGKEIGFIQINEREQHVDHYDGLELLKQVWLFQEDGTTTHVMHSMFVSNDLAYEQWENRLSILQPGREGGPPQAFIDRESAIRQDDQLVIKYSPQPNSTEMKEKVLEIASSYAPAPWDLLCPRLLDLRKAELYGFSVYDAGRRGLILKTLRVVGPDKLSAGGKSIPAIKIEDSEGLIPPISEVLVDASGRILRVEASPVEMLATSRDYVERRYKSRVDDALASFQRLSEAR